MAKSASQLDREITAVLKRPQHRARRAHSTRIWEPFAKPDWDVILDMLLEHHPEKAAQVWHKLREIEGDTSRPASFIHALRNVPEDVRLRYEELTVPTADRHVAAITKAQYQTKDPDELIAAVSAAKKYVTASRRNRDADLSDPSLYKLRNMLVDAEKAVKRIKKDRKAAR